jgi:hypothetical protein
MLIRRINPRSSVSICGRLRAPRNRLARGKPNSPFAVLTICPLIWESRTSRDHESWQSIENGLRHIHVEKFLAKIKGRARPVSHLRLDQCWLCLALAQKSTQIHQRPVELDIVKAGYPDGTVDGRFPDLLLPFFIERCH